MTGDVSANSTSEGVGTGVDPEEKTPGAADHTEDSTGSSGEDGDPLTFTFTGRATPHNVLMLRIVTVSVVALLFFLVIPVLTVKGVVPTFKLNILGKYFCFTLVALGIDLIWGYTGILSLCQALFFCIGGYAMAMHLSLKQGGGDVRPEYNNIPAFMFFNNVKDLPLFWKPFESFIIAILAAICLPALVSGVLGFFILRSRVRGVYFSIVTQAIAWGAVLLFQRNEMLLGGSNGLTGFYKGFNEKTSWIVGLYLLTLVIVALAYVACWMITNSRLGRVLVAIRDRETRLYFAGYKPYAFKVFAFTVGGMLAGIGGMLYSPQVGIITPFNLSVETSILMVIWVALGGRGKLWGAIFGALLTNVTLSSLSSDLPGLWLYVQGGMFVLVVLLFPEGFAGLWVAAERQLATGMGWARAALTASPLVIVGLFVLGEALALTPNWLLAPIYQSEKIGKIEWKYVVLILLLVLVSIWQTTLTRRQKAAA